MNQKSKIQIWDYHEPINLNKVVVNINHEKSDLPEDVENRVKTNWVAFKSNNPKAEDKDTAYLVSYKRSGSEISSDVFTAGFSYNQWLNRDDIFMTDSTIANQLNYNPFASWIIAVCDNEKYALFGNKKHFGDKNVSGFGGFTSQEDIIDNKIDVYHFIQRKLEEEMKEMSSAIAEKYIIGLDYCSIVGPKGFDGVYVVELDGEADQLQKYFGKCEQFSKQLIPIKTDPKSLLDFLESSEWEPTNFCIGGVFNYIGSRYGREELLKTLSQYSKKDLVHIFDEPFNGNVRTKK